MATVLQPIVNETNTALVQLRTELRGRQTDADGDGIAINMTCCREASSPRLVSWVVRFVGWLSVECCRNRRGLVRLSSRQLFLVGRIP